MDGIKTERCKDDRGMISAIEKELCVVEGLDEKEVAERSGRSKGVSYCWKNALVKPRRVTAERLRRPEHGDDMRIGSET